MMVSLGAEGQEPSGTRVAPMALNSASSKMRRGDCSILML